MIVEGTRQVLEREGAKGLARWMKNQKRVLFTDTTMRDAHQSLLATRMRSVRHHPHRARPIRAGCRTCSRSNAGAGRRSTSPCASSTRIRGSGWPRCATGAPNILTQMLLRGSNGVGYTNYPDNVVKFFVAQAAKGGVDVFRIFDCLNWVENMRVSIDAVVESRQGRRGGDLLHRRPASIRTAAKYDLKYYVGLAKELEAAGAHILAHQGHGGAAEAGRGEEADRDAEAGGRRCRSTSTRTTPRALRRRRSWRRSMPASMWSMRRWMRSRARPAADARLAGRGARGRAARSGARSSRRSARSRSTGKRCARSTARSRAISRSGASEVYLHEMPGGQFTNLKEQARSLGLESRWHEVGAAPMPTSTRCSATS